MVYAGKVNLAAIELGFKTAVPGVTLLDVSDKIERFLLNANCSPAFKDYQPTGSPSPFPGAVCLSPNDVVVHGVPNDYTLKDGDLLTIDLGTKYKDCFVDAARSRIIGEEPIISFASLLIKATESILEAQLKTVKHNSTFLELVEAAEEAALCHNVRIAPRWGGHRIGEAIHIDPFVPNAINTELSTMRQTLQKHLYGRQSFQAGNYYCIEPVVVRGTTDITIDDDGWTIRTKDGGLACHTERCLLVTDSGYQIIS